MSRENIAKFDQITKVWKGPFGQYPYSMDTYIGDLLIKAFDENPDKIIQINHDEGTEWIARDLKLASIGVAQNYIKMGLKEDDVIGFNVRNSQDIYPLLIACNFVGVMANPLHVSFTKDGIKQMFNQTKPKVVFCDSDVYDAMKEALKELENDAKIFTMLGEVSGVSSYKELLTPTGIESDFVPLKFTKPADKKATSISCSSGTTGEPKGVLCTHAYVISWTYLVMQPSPIHYKSFNFSPIYWGSGLAGLISAILNPMETRIATKHPFNVELLIEIVEKYKPSILTLPPSQLVPFLNSPLSKTCDFSSVKVVISFGSIVTEELREKFKETFPRIFLSTLYAMTECPGTFAFYGDSFVGLTVGKIASNIYLKIVDEDGKNVGFNEQGEIRLKYELGFAGYHNNPKATEEALDEEGYFKTGDIGYFDESASLFVVDRMKEIFKHRGYHVRS
jgi:4-coumarate--CoA ligase